MFMHDRPIMKTLMTYPYVTWDNWFSEENLQQIEDYCKTQTINSATIVSGNRYMDRLTLIKHQTMSCSTGHRA